MPVTRWKKKNINSRLPLYLPGRVFIVDVVRIFPPVPGSEGAMAFCPPKRTGKDHGVCPVDSHRDEKTQALLFPSVGYIWHPCDIKCKKCIGDDVVDGTGSTGSWHNAPDRLKLPVFVILILTGIFLEGVVHYHYGINIVYTQFYYLIVVVAGSGTEEKR